MYLLFDGTPVGSGWVRYGLPAFLSHRGARRSERGKLPCSQASYSKHCSQCNILIDKHGCAVISDFGLSKVMEGMEKVGSSFAVSVATELILALVDEGGESAIIDVQRRVLVWYGMPRGGERAASVPHRKNDEAALIDIMRGGRPCRSEMWGVALAEEDEEAFWRYWKRCWDPFYWYPRILASVFPSTRLSSSCVILKSSDTLPSCNSLLRFAVG